MKTSCIFEAYKSTRTLEEADLSWLEGRLTDAEVKELKKQIDYLLMEAEEEAFFSALACPARMAGA